MCTLRAYGTEFDVDTFLASSPLAPSTVFKKGEPRRPNTASEGPKHNKSGVCIGVSDAEWSDLAAQVSDAEQFLISNRIAIEALAAMPGIEDFLLDFPIELRADGIKIATQTDIFSPALVRIAGTFGLGLALTIYS